MRSYLQSSSSLFISLFLLSAFCNKTSFCQITLDKEGTLWAPFIEWEVTNPSFEVNPFDVLATVTFTHESSGATHRTEMFYDENNTWKWRFSGTELGTWTFTTASEDSDLNGLQGTVTITPHPDPDTYGFMTQVTSKTHTKWARTLGNNGIIEPFTPQLVMFDSNPANFHNNPDYVDGSIDVFLRTHGFTGFHLAVIGARWFDIDAPGNALTGNETQPDPRTFEALELLITKTHTAGGLIHIWPWGDASRDQVPLELEDGANGLIDERLQRYIAARLGPIPGWSMGYGFDLFEWTDETMLRTWHENMHSFLGWPHYLGGRAHKNQLSQIYEGFDYSSYEWHRPTYQDYLDHITTRPDKPAFSEDRFRIRNRTKDYTMEETRRGLWHSSLAGGVANIWGNLRNEDGSTAEHSNPYPNPEWIHTYTQFWKGRFLQNMEPCNELSDAYCIGDADLNSYVLYKEAVDELSITLPGNNLSLPAIVVDTQNPYVELGPCTIPANGFTWNLPYESDWAIAVGDFGQSIQPGSFDCDTLPVELNYFNATSDGEDILLSWSTSSEQNNAGFEIQYRTRNQTLFQSYQFVEGEGTSDTGRSYHVRLTQFAPGSYVFRLKQIDFDGTFAYSNEQVHPHRSASAFTITRAHPSPFQYSTTMALSVARPQQVQVTLYDSLGRAIRRLFDSEMTAQTQYQIHIEAGTLPNGPYFVQLKGDYFRTSERIILAR